MVELPEKMIKSLTELGLLESEAKIYAALVFLQSAEVRDLLEFLDVSKPSIYEGLRMLEKNDLIVLTNPRPAMYQAIEPKIALEIILNKYEDAKKEALIELENFKNQEISTKPNSPLWFIFGAKSFEFKIKDMLKNAKESIYCQTSVKYLDYIEKIVKKNIQIHLVVKTDIYNIDGRFERLSRMSNVNIKIIDKNDMCSDTETDKKEEERMKRSIGNMEEYMDLENQFMLVVDDSEFLAVPPLKSDSLTAITSTNKALIFNSKIAIEKSLYIV
jgi:HTH-type transcriptional regulator, sugar sensing transcriptional regulator